MSNPLIDSRVFGLMAEPGVTDLLLSGRGLCSVVRGVGLEARAWPFDSEAELDRLAVDLIAAGGRQLDAAHPFADVVVGEFRVHACLRSAASAHTQVSIRFLGARQVALDQLASVGMFDQSVAAGLRGIIAARQNFLISGPTGVGKTTLLRVLLGLVSSERVLTIEDLPELRLEGNAVELLVRRANLEGRGEISMSELLIQALRMRPDRIAVGELRSEELLVLLEALNTGHSGSGATIHANELEAVPARLLAIGLRHGLAEPQLARLAAAAFDWVIQVGIEAGARRITGIGRLLCVDGQLRVERVGS